VIAIIGALIYDSVRGGFGNWHPGIYNFLLGDGSVRRVTNITGTSTLKALAMVNDWCCCFVTVISCQVSVSDGTAKCRKRNFVLIHPIETLFTVQDQSVGILNAKHAKIPQNIAKLIFMLFRVF
jgi:hypothetical protein